MKRLICALLLTTYTVAVPPIQDHYVQLKAKEVLLSSLYGTLSLQHIQTFIKDTQSEANISTKQIMAIETQLKEDPSLAYRIQTAIFQELTFLNQVKWTEPFMSFALNP